MNLNLQKLRRRVALGGLCALLSIATLTTWAAARIQDLQEIKVTIGFKGGETLEKAFGRLSEVSKIPFNYNHNELRQVSAKHLEFKNEALSHVLNSILSGTNFQYKESNHGIVIYYKPVEKQSASKTLAEQAIVHGVVSDETGPLPGVTIRIKNRSSTTITRADGSYSIKAEQGDVLLFSMLGYKTKEVVIGTESSINLMLEPTTNSLSEVVVVGYGTQKKINVTGSVATVDAKDFADRPVASVTNALQGKMAGITITTTNGQPGRDDGTINIRGIGTGLGPADVRANASPIVIIDGVPGSMGEVNPNDIESISVLKDAASSAIYGARASNGVVLITTKKGKKGALQLHYDMYAGKQSINKRPDFLPSWQQAELYNEARANEKLAPKWTANDIQLFKDGTDQTGAHPNTDWLSLLYTEPGLKQNHNLSLSGGDEKSKFMVSLGYLGQKGNVKGTSFQKYNALFNVSSQLNKSLAVNARLGFLYSPFSEPVSTYATGFSQLVRMINRVSNTVPYKWGNGAYGYVADGSPMAWLESGSYNRTQDYKLTGNVGLDWSPLQGLHVKPNFAYRLATGQRQQYVNDIQYYSGGPAGTPLVPTKYEGPNNLTNSNNRTTYTLVQAVADYEKSIGKNNFKLLIGASQEHSAYNDFSAYRQGFLNNSLQQINAGPQSGQATTGSANEWGLESAFSRLNYNFNEKYLFEANFRADGSSRFAPGHRWGFFPSASAGWVISKEDFFSPLADVVDVFKLRTFWGKLGNQQIANNYAYFESIATKDNQYSFNQNLSTGIAPGTGGNPNVSWEVTESYGAGLDAVLIHNKLNFSVDYFVRNTNNPLMPAVVGAPYAFTAPYVNVDGGISNKGVEISTGYADAIGNVKYSVNGNFSYTENKVTRLTGGKVINDNTFYDVGTPINSLYGFQAEGIYQSAAEVNGTAVLNNKVSAGDIKYKDQNGDGKIDANDKVYLGTYFPKITYGLTLAADWNNFGISLFLQGTGGVKAMGGSMIGQIGADVQKPTPVFLDRWTPTNPSETFPRLWYNNKQNDPGSNPSSFWVKDASYLRVKNVTFSYTIPATLVKKIGLSNLKVYYSGQNLLTFTKFYKWIDPEIGSAGSIYSYPQVITNTIGLNASF